MLGPLTVISVPGIGEEEQGDVLVGMDLDVLLVDLDESALGGMRRYDPVTDLVFEAYVPEAAHIMPQPETLVRLGQGVGRGGGRRSLAFYSAQEEAQAPPAVSPKRPAPKKRVTMGQLSDQVAAIAAVIPALADRSDPCRGRAAGCGLPHLSRPRL